MPIRPENRTRYPKNWSEISLRIKTRAGWRCECEGECGRGTHEFRCPNIHGKPAYGTGSKVILTTAHLNHTPEDCEDENLKAMCQGCHLWYDKDHHAETRRRNKMSDPTITAYENGYAEYVNGTPTVVDGLMKAWLDSIPHTGRLLEFGSGTGRDAEYLTRQGWEVTCSDAAKVFVDALKAQGYDTLTLNLLTDPIPAGSWSTMIANAVLLHFAPKQIKKVLEKISSSLPMGGVFACSLKMGTGGQWVTEKLNSPRYFQYWTEEKFTQALTKAGFEEPQTIITPQWGFFTAKKN